MADDHNIERYGETWPQYKIDAYLEVLYQIKHFVVLSGGWAWHFLSPKGHVEYKHAHDHKDLDLMVPPRTVATVMSLLQGMGFEKVGTKYDHLPSEEDFRRYEKVVYRENEDPEGEAEGFRLTIDFFVKEVPFLQVPGGWMVVRPDELVSYYSTIHSSKSAWAVVAAKAILEAGGKPEDIVGDPQLGITPLLDVWVCSKCGWSGQFPVKQGNMMVCGGCQEYIPFNHGKPSFRPRPKVMKDVAAFFDNLDRGIKS